MIYTVIEYVDFVTQASKGAWNVAMACRYYQFLFTEGGKNYFIIKYLDKTLKDKE